MADDPFYYQTSVQMVDRWTELNNYVVPNFGKGGHCHVHSTVRARTAAVHDTHDDRWCTHACACGMDA
jgi:hypothetical protein